MRFFSVALPLMLGTMAIAAPMVAQQDQAQAKREQALVEARQLPALPGLSSLDPTSIISTVTGASGQLTGLFSSITANPTDVSGVTGLLEEVVAILENLLSSLGLALPALPGLSGITLPSVAVPSVAVPSVSLPVSLPISLPAVSLPVAVPSASAVTGGLGGLLGGLLGKLHLRAATDDQLNTLSGELQTILTGVQGIVQALPAETTTVPVVGQLLTSLEPLLNGLVGGVNGLVPGVINTVRTTLQTVGGILNNL